MNALKPSFYRVTWNKRGLLIYHKTNSYLAGSNRLSLREKKIY